MRHYKALYRRLRRVTHGHVAGEEGQHDQWNYQQ